MLNKLIEPYNYYDDNHFALEIEKIFKEKWLFSCLLYEVQNKNDYFVLDIGINSVIIYNNGKEILAFQNLCPHRFNRIFINNKGNSVLKCQFHSWSFDKCGVIKNKNIAETDELRKKYSLKQYPIEIIGQFIFFNFNEKPILTFKEQIQGIEEDLLIISGILSSKIHEENNIHKVNWKFICENVVDKTHCLSLHKDTLVKIGYCIEMEEDLFQDENSSKITLPPVINEARIKRDRFLNKYLPRKLQNNNYQHLLHFPNLTIGIYEGLNITIGNILPLKSSKTNYRLIYYNSKIEKLNDTSINLLNAMSDEVVNFGSKVFDEDKVILEQVQKGVREANHSGYVYDNELRIKWFYEVYNKIINNGKF
ncbi:MAG: aromatic ring-hydroxylating oxygenase subunit alpha [Bacteroidota bacterium]